MWMLDLFWVEDDVRGSFLVKTKSQDGSFGSFWSHLFDVLGRNKVFGSEVKNVGSHWMYCGWSLDSAFSLVGADTARTQWKSHPSRGGRQARAVPGSASEPDVALLRTYHCFWDSDIQAAAQRFVCTINMCKNYAPTLRYQTQQSRECNLSTAGIAPHHVKFCDASIGRSAIAPTVTSADLRSMCT